MQIDTSIEFDPLRRDVLIAILKDKGRGPTLYSLPYEKNPEIVQQRYWVDFLRYARDVINGKW